MLLSEKSNKLKTSLIIPCYNEGPNLLKLFNRCRKLFNNNQIEIIFVNNGSNDNSQKIFEILKKKNSNLKVLSIKKNKGYGYGIIRGIKISTGDILSFTHSDLQTDPTDILKGIKIFKKYGLNNFVKGKRYGRSIFDIFFTISMSIFESILFFKPFWDINAQPTMFPRKLFNICKNPPHDFSLDLYFYYKAIESGLKIKRFPVYFAKRNHGNSKWNTGFMSRYKFIIKTLNFSLSLKNKIIN